MGWQFVVGEWIGGIALVVIMTILVRLTYPKHLVSQMRRHLQEGVSPQHDQASGNESLATANITAPPRTAMPIITKAGHPRRPSPFA